jgi:hypothetical protein
MFYDIEDCGDKLVIHLYFAPYYSINNLNTLSADDKNKTCRNFHIHEEVIRFENSDVNYKKLKTFSFLIDYKSIPILRRDSS